MGLQVNSFAAQFFLVTPLLFLSVGASGSESENDIHSNKTTEKSLQIFNVKTEDESLSLALRRWAHEHRHRLIWDAGKDFPAKETTYHAIDLVTAVEQVMTDTERSSYPLHACAYRNRVIRVLHISQPCERR